VSFEIKPSNFANISKLMCGLVAALQFVTGVIEHSFHVSEKEVKGRFTRRIILLDLVPEYVEFLNRTETEIFCSRRNPWVQV